MSIEAIIYIGIGMCIGIYFFLLELRLKVLDAAVKKIPTAEDMARQILKTKIPINELPDDIKNEFKNIMDKKNKEKIDLKSEIKSYTG
jgi:hypothetical protein